MVEHLLQVAVRGLSQTVSSSQGWSLHKAILQSLKKCIQADEAWSFGLGAGPFQRRVQIQDSMQRNVCWAG